MKQAFQEIDRNKTGQVYFIDLCLQITYFFNKRITHRFCRLHCFRSKLRTSFYRIHKLLIVFSLHYLLLYNN